MHLQVKKEEGWRPQDKSYLAVSVNGSGGKYLYYSDLLTLAHQANESGEDCVAVEDVTKIDPGE